MTPRCAYVGRCDAHQVTDNGPCNPSWDDGDKTEIIEYVPNDALGVAVMQRLKEEAK